MFERMHRFLVHSAKIGKLLPFFLGKLLPLSGKGVISFSAFFPVLTIPSHEFLALLRFSIDAINSPGTKHGWLYVGRCMLSVEFLLTTRSLHSSRLFLLSCQRSAVSDQLLSVGCMVVGQRNSL